MRRTRRMNQAQLNQRIVDDALMTLREARLARQAVIKKVATWFPEGGHEQWAEECFKRLWLSYHETEGSTGYFKQVLCDVLHSRFPGHSSRWDWQGASIVVGCLKTYGGGYHDLNVRLPLEGRNFCSSRTDDEFEELIEDWEHAVREARGIKDSVLGPFAEKVPISEWILTRFDKLAWHYRDKDYWCDIFKIVEIETFLPPKNISYQTARRKKWLWHCFRQLVAAHAKASERHIPKDWYNEKVVPQSHADWIKKVRYLFRVVKDSPGAARGNDPVADYGERIGRMIDGEMRKLAREIDDGCIDNWRFAAKDKPGDMRRYRAQRDQGCCGYADKEVTIYGRKFVIGCNYGH